MCRLRSGQKYSCLHVSANVRFFGILCDIGFLKFQHVSALWGSDGVKKGLGGSLMAEVCILDGKWRLWDEYSRMNIAWRATGMRERDQARPWERSRKTFLRLGDMLGGGLCMDRMGITGRESRSVSHGGP